MAKVLDFNERLAAKREQEVTARELANFKKLWACATPGEKQQMKDAIDRMDQEAWAEAVWPVTLRMTMKEFNR